MSLPDADADANADDTLSEPTEAQVAKRYGEGPAALLTDVDLERLVDAARGKSARKIKILA